MSRNKSFSKKRSSKSTHRNIPVEKSSSSEEVDNEEIFEVEAILDKRILAGQVSVLDFIQVEQKN